MKMTIKMNGSDEKNDENEARKWEDLNVNRKWLIKRVKMTTENDWKWLEKHNREMVKVTEGETEWVTKTLHIKKQKDKKWIKMNTRTKMNEN